MSDDVIGGSTKTVQQKSRISLEIEEQCSLNLTPKMYIAKETKWHPLCYCHDNSYAADPVLIKNKIPRFYLNKWEKRMEA